MTASILAISKWVVGSSSSRKLGGESKSLTRANRLFSPPLRTFTFLKTSSPRKRKAPSRVRASCSWTFESVFSIASSTTVRSRFRTSTLCCEKYPTETLCPSSREPSSIGTSSARIFNRVDFPAPFGPTRAIRSCFSTSRFRSE